MKLYKYIIGLALLVSSSSCDFLDEEAYEFITPDNFYKTEADANAALTAVYNNFNDDKGLQTLYLGWEPIFQVKRLMLMPVRLHVWRWIIYLDSDNGLLQKYLADFLFHHSPGKQPVVEHR